MNFPQQTVPAMTGATAGQGCGAASSTPMMVTETTTITTPGARLA